MAASTPATPVRLQLSRRKGFNLQALSLATNGLPAVKVARPGMWGNPFVVHPNHPPGKEWFGMAGKIISVPSIEDAVSCFEEMMKCPGETSDALRDHLPELRGKNLACFCRLDQRCHADTLIALANIKCEESA